MAIGHRFAPTKRFPARRADFHHSATSALVPIIKRWRSIDMMSRSLCGISKLGTSNDGRRTAHPSGQCCSVREDRFWQAVVMIAPYDFGMCKRTTVCMCYADMRAVFARLPSLRDATRTATAKLPRLTRAVNGWQVAVLISLFGSGMCKLEHV